MIRNSRLQIARAQEQTAAWLARVDPTGGLAALVAEARAHDGALDEHDYQSLIERSLREPPVASGAPAGADGSGYSNGAGARLVLARLLGVMP